MFNSPLRHFPIVIGALLWALAAGATPMFLGVTTKPFCGGLTCNSWSLTDKSANVTISNGGLTATDNLASGDVAGRSVQHKSTGKFYFELHFVNTSGSDSGGGFASLDATFSGSNCYGCNGTQGFLVFGTGGAACFNGTCGKACAPFASVANKYLTMAIDKINNFLYCRSINVDDTCGIWVNINNGTLANPVTGFNGADISAVFAAKDVYAAYGFNVQNNTLTANFGATPFYCPVPNGFTPGFYQ